MMSTSQPQQWAYLGPEGTFTEQATRELAADRPVVLCAHATVSTAVNAVREGAVDAAVVPLENSVEGLVPVTHDELLHTGGLRITAEAYVPIRFNILIRPGVRELKTVGSHPHALAQVRTYLAEQLPNASTVVCDSTAAAARAVAAGELDAAVAAPLAAERYQLHSQATDVGDVRGAVTRFVLVQTPGALPQPTGNDRTTIVLALPNRPGTLVDAIGEISGRGVNMTRLESRPARTTLAEHLFVIDLDGHLRDDALADCLAALHRREMLRAFLGSYPRGDGHCAHIPAHAQPQAYRNAAEFLKSL